jgi:hypothetical protein
MTKPRPVGPSSWVVVMERRRAAAIAWRVDHAHHPDREALWRSYVNGATVYVRMSRDDRAATVAGCTAAERLVPWPALREQS